ncbi:hypothetical protein [Castellaniella sp.]|uniref:hypothetical protein n=1 Tax=Castellaniella sp. TaxID=1955812 RepID=UPI003A90D6FD
MTKEALSNPAQIHDHIACIASGGGKQYRISHEAVPNSGSLSRTKTGTITGRRRRLRDVDEFPIGIWVKTPTGRLGVVVAHKGAESKEDAHERCTVRYHRGGGEDRDTVTLLPHLLKPASEGPQMELLR